MANEDDEEIVESESESQSIQSNAGRLEPVAQVPFPSNWEFDVRADPDSGEAEFTYERSAHPEFDAQRLAMRNAIEIYNVGKTYEIETEVLGKEIWTDDVWRVTQVLDECYHCALGQYGQHEGPCETLFDVVEKRIENERLRHVLNGVDNVGDDLVDRIAKRFDSVFDVKDAPKEDLTQIKYVGDLIADDIRRAAEEDAQK